MQPLASKLLGGTCLTSIVLLVTFAMSPEIAFSIPLPKPRPESRRAAPVEITKPRAPAVSQQIAAPASPVPSRPRRNAVAAAIATSGLASQADRDTLERVIDLVRKQKQTDATQLQETIADPTARKLTEWIILRSSDNGATAERYRAFINANPSWPALDYLRRKAEATLWDDHRDDTAVLNWFADDTPLSAKGRLVLAHALLAKGDRRGAERHLREAWRSDDMSDAVEAKALEQFAALLGPGDHKARMDYLLFGNSEDALRSAQRLGGAQLAIARARAAVTRKASNAKALLDAVPSDAHGDASYIFAKLQYLRRQDEIAEAGQLMLRAPRDPARLGNVDEWWVERRLLARKLLDIGDARTAYVVARDAAAPARDIYRTEHEFTAGWIALRFLKDPATALQHFDRIGVNSVNPTALARGGYWRGRALEALGRRQEAQAAYETAGAHSTSYYGQLARARLGLPQIALNKVPGSRTRGIERFEIARAVELLYALDEQKLAAPILATMGQYSDDPDVLIALAESAARHEDARGVLLIGKGALNRGMPFDFYAYPVSGIPPYRSIGPEVEPSIVYAIARQESAFDPTVVSSANAMGLLQVTPAAGKYVTKKYGASFDLQRLRNDPAYNATLGAAELGGLIQDYRGSYIMTFAAYNAGRGSVKKWIDRYGDPRDPAVDAVDWVEQIPFSETRNYVQRVMENLQVYRARFGGGMGLQIEADLKRGATVEQN